MPEKPQLTLQEASDMLEAIAAQLDHTYDALPPSALTVSEFADLRRMAGVLHRSATDLTRLIQAIRVEEGHTRAAIEIIFDFTPCGVSFRCRCGVQLHMSRGNAQASGLFCPQCGVHHYLSWAEGILRHGVKENQQREGKRP